MKKLYEGNLKKNFFWFALPLVITVFLAQAYQIINTVLAGKLIGDAAISAIGSTAPFVSFISSLFWGYGTGFSIYVAMLFGKGETSKMLNVIKVNLWLSALIVLAVSFFCIVFHKAIFSFLQIEESLAPAAFSYFAIYMAGLVFLHLNWCFVYIANAIGLSVLPLLASVLTNILNIAGSYLLIRYTQMGVAGIATATVISAVVTFVFYLVCFLYTFRKSHIHSGRIYFDKQELRASLEYAFPTMLQQSVMYLCTALVSPLTNRCGANAIAGYTVGMRLYDLNAGVYQNSNKTITNYIAQCMGAKQYSRIKEGIRVGLFMTILFLLPVLLITVFAAQPLAKLFLDGNESIRYAKIFMQFCMPFVFFNVINNLLHAIFRSTGAGRYLVLATVVYSVSRFGYSYLLFGRYQMYGIYLAVVLAWVTEAIFGFLLYRFGNWGKEIKNEECKVQNAK